MTEIFVQDRLRRLFLGLFAVSAIVCAIATNLHYTRKFPGNPFTWAAWIAALLFLLAAYGPNRQEVKQWAVSVWDDQKFVRIFFFLALLFLVSHVWNLKTAPWNQNGLFDDAAWDIYFAKQHIFTHAAFQTAISEGIARETIFHYYIGVWFVLFGYNLLSFFFALLFLGMTTFLFTALIVHHLFKNYLVTVVSALVFNFLPFHFIQTFIGHRYAAAAPLLTGSLYFLMTGFSRRSAFRVVLSAILAALCVESAIMGKQFLMCLAGAAVLLVATDYRRSVTKETVRLAIIFVVGLTAALLPMIVFIYYNKQVYFAHEQELSALFFQAYKNRASGALAPYINDLKGIFFAPMSPRRLSMFDCLLVPLWYYVFLVPGIVIALLKKRYEIVLLATVPIAGAFISTAYDFRVLHAAPFWIILMAFSFHALMRLETVTRSYLINLGVLAVAGWILAAGLIPSIKYLYAKSKDPFSIYLLGQQDVGVARFLQDLVAGVPHPSSRRKPDEFRRAAGLPAPKFDALACTESGFAIPHLFLQDYGDREIMSFCDQLPMMHFTDVGLFTTNKRAVSNYKGTKDLMLIWQQTPKSDKAIAAFGKLNQLGTDRRLMMRHGGRTYTFYVLTIPRANVPQFKQEIAGLTL